MSAIPLVPGAYGKRLEHRRTGSRFDVYHQVPLVPQQNGMSCWAAAAAMLVGWRDALAVEGPEVARGSGRWSAYQRGLRPRDVPHLASTWGLRAVSERHHTVQSLRRLLEEYGPLWMGEAVPGLHVIAVTGMYGDGTPTGTRVRINDPWPVGRGERYSLTVDELMRNFNAASQVAGYHIQLLHTGGRRASASPTRGTSYRMEESWESSVVIDTGADAPQTAQRRPEPLSEGHSIPVRWPDDADSICYSHIDRAGLNGAFDLSHRALQRLADLNHFDLSGEQRVIFGLRGASLVGTGDAFAAAISIDEDIPDHVDRHCIIGVWDRTARTVAAFSGSTVPNARSVRRQQADPTNLGIANLLPTGLYSYQVGRHRDVPGALRQNGPVVVLRSLDDGIYTTRDSFFVHFPADNIHPTFRSGTTFSSAGCNTVHGNYDDGHTGAWRTFRRRLGLTDSQTSAPSPFRYMLLTGREVRHAVRLGDRLRRLRFGSSGASVQALQDALRRAGRLEFRSGRFHLPASSHAHITVAVSTVPGDPPGRMLANTTMAWVLHQQAATRTADGIVTPAAGRRLGFDMVRRMSIPVR